MFQSIDEPILALPEMAKPFASKLKGHDAEYLVESGKTRRLVTIRGGEVAVCDAPEEDTGCVIRAEEDTLLDLANGKLNPAKALLFGKVKITGDKRPLLQLIALLG